MFHKKRLDTESLFCTPMIFVFLCCIFGLLILAAYFTFYFRAWHRAGGDLSSLTRSLKWEAKKLAPGVVLWATLGGLCGLIGVFIMSRVAGIALLESGGWLWIGIATGVTWGFIWGIIYGITEQKS